MDLIQKIIHAITQVHPPHIMFTHFPIALTGAALFFIILALWKKNEIFEKIAFANISLAAVSALVAAPVGIRDNIHFYNGLAPNHVLKIILASTLFVITATTDHRAAGRFFDRQGRRVVCNDRSFAARIVGSDAQLIVCAAAIHA